MEHVDIYAVGVLGALLKARRAVKASRHDLARHYVMQEWRYLIYQARRRNWRAVRNSFNGYLAEDETTPYCGHGWTHSRALRSLDRRRSRWMADA